MTGYVEKYSLLVNVGIKLSTMRWEDLFDDLESQLEQELTAEELDLEDEEERLRLGRLSVRDRLVSLSGSRGGASLRLAVTLVSGQRMVVHPVAFGRDWFSVDVITEGTRSRQCIVPIAALASVALESTLVSHSLDGPAVPSLSDRLGLVFVLRDLCRRRRPVDIALVTADLHGTLDRVGRDHLDLAVHERGVPRRETAVRDVRIVPFAAVQLVRL